MAEKLGDFGDTYAASFDMRKGSQHGRSGVEPVGGYLEGPHGGYLDMVN